MCPMPHLVNKLYKLPDIGIHVGDSVGLFCTICIFHPIHVQDVPYMYARIWDDLMSHMCIGVLYAYGQQVCDAKYKKKSVCN